MTEKSYLMNNYSRSALTLTSGAGARLYSNNPQDQPYLDFHSGVGVNALGHRHHKIMDAMNYQAGRLIHVGNTYSIEGLEKLAETLCDASGFAGGVIMTNSGAEANEAALKMIRKYQHGIGHPERHHVIAFHNAFHGRTLGTIFASVKAKMVEGFGPPTVKYKHADFNDLASVEALVTKHTGGIILEPIQGEGGITAATPEFLKGLRDLCDRKGIVLVFDEIQCGAGRTGQFYSYLEHGVFPDIVTTAKGIGGGYPVGAAMATENIARFITPGTHGSTYSGSPMAVLVAQTVIDVIRGPNFMDRVKARGDYLKEQLEGMKNDVLLDVTGKGLMVGLKVAVEPGVFVQRLQDNHLLAVAAGNNCVRLLPPLIITTQEIDEGLSIIRKTAKSLSPS